MKKSHLKQIVQEEIFKALNENSGYKQLKLTAKGELLLGFVNDDSGKNIDYHINTNEENLIQDIGMYIDELYGDNKFTDLEIFAIDIASQEYQDIERGKISILRNIKIAINKGWVEIVPYIGQFGKNDKDWDWLDPEDSDIPV